METPTPQDNQATVKNALIAFLHYINTPKIRFLQNEKRKYFQIIRLIGLDEQRTIVAFLDKTTGIVYKSQTATRPSPTILNEDLTRLDLWHYLRDKLINT